MLGITTKQNLIPCCVVWIDEGIEGFVPIAATDRAAEATIIFPVPLNIVAVQQLLATFERIASQSVEGMKNESNRQTKQETLSGINHAGSATRRAGSGASADMGVAHVDAAADGGTAACSDRTLFDSGLRGGEQ
jgi:hypothetical protein